MPRTTVPQQHRQPDFTSRQELLEQVKAEGVKIAHVTLHVGLGTFRPVKVDDVEQHHMHSEFYMVEEDQAKLINDTKKAGGRVISVGTTSCRTLESATGEDGILQRRKRLDRDLYLSGLQIQDDRRTDHQLPPAGIHADDAGFRSCRQGKHHGSL